MQLTALRFYGADHTQVGCYTTSFIRRENPAYFYICCTTFRLFVSAD